MISLNGEKPLVAAVLRASDWQVGPPLVGRCWHKVSKSHSGLCHEKIILNRPIHLIGKILLSQLIKIILNQSPIRCTE